MTLPTPKPLDPLLESLRLHIVSIETAEPVPLREAWRGPDPTLGNRVRERHTTVEAMALHGHPNAADMLLAIEKAGWHVESLAETAYSHSRPIFGHVNWPWTYHKIDFHGMSHGMIEANVTLVVVEFLAVGEEARA